MMKPPISRHTLRQAAGLGASALPDVPTVAEMGDLAPGFRIP